MDPRSRRNMAMRHRTISSRSSIWKTSNRIDDELSSILQAIEINHSQAVKLCNQIQADCRKQMSKENQTRMLKTYASKLPTGLEQGDYVVIDFGGRFFRVVYVKLGASHGESIFMESKIYPQSQEIMTADIEVLFEFIAASVLDFCKKFKLLTLPELQLIMVNAFPCRHFSLKDAHLIRWTKTIDAKGAFSKSLRDLLVQALKKVGINQELNVLCNDSTACLYTGLAEDPNSRLGVILGTGFNIAVMSPTETSNSTDPTNQSETGTDKWTVYNSEIGSFGDNGELEDILTSFDRVVHNGEMSTHKGEQILEKMITGKYLAELFRLICKDLIDTGVLFNGISSELFDRVGKIPRNFLSQIINAGKEGLNHVQDVLINLEIAAMYADAEAVVKIAEALVHRAAKLAAAAVVGVLKSSNENKRLVSITFDGSLWKSFPYLSERIRMEASILIDPETELQFRTSFDGSAKGAAFIAATSLRKPDST